MPDPTPAPPFVPLLWVKKNGVDAHVPLASLKFEYAWEVVPGKHVKYVERYVDADGDVVKESAAVLSAQPLGAAAAVPGNVGG